MLGLDERLAALSHGGSLWIVLAVAVLLGLRHATDPDHLAAVTTLVAGGRERAARRACELGLAWGLGHATTLFAFGLPIVLLNDYVPERVQQGAETAVGLVIVYLAVRLLRRWRRGDFHFHAHPHAHGARTRAGAFAIGLAHGMGGSAGVGVLLLASIQSPTMRMPRWPARWNAAMRWSGMAWPTWMCGAVTSIPSLTRSGRPRASLRSSSPSGRRCTAFRVSSSTAAIAGRF